MFFNNNAIDRKTRKILQKVNGLGDRFGRYTDEELRSMTDTFRERLQKGETLNDILPEAYALVREASGRVLGMRPFDVQIIGGIELHNGKIAEMKTGEGKTLVAVLPAYLNALNGKGVHIVTVNDYLAERDAQWMGKVHEFLGLTVGVVLSNMSTQQRKEAYACDITYVTNNELGFDYLRDNMVTKASEQVLRGLHYCIIDEVDSVLIDEARTPLIISGQSGRSTKIYESADLFVKTLKRGDDLPELTRSDIIMGVEQKETGDYIVNEKDKYVTLTESGIWKAEKFFGVKNISDAEHVEIMHCIMMALRANSLMLKDRDYIVKDNEVLIVDEFTGRVMEGRRYSDGLHQAIEAKEHVGVKEETATLATITFQNFFNKFEKKAGMTGTAATEKKEFKEIYGLDIVVIPTNRPVIRIDREDSVFKTKKEKYERVVRAVIEAHEKGQPVLVGTASIEVSEHLSSMLKKEGIPHNVLNAKQHEKEAEIIADAGHYGSVTIATNMAGRGTDIKLDDDARAAGGLKVIGTERHESRRIDNQIRGRSGRQGDPGESKFYLSLEDDILRLFGSERMMSVFNALGIGYGEEITDKSITKAVATAQKRVEGNNFSIRKSLMEYDRVNNEQREIIYGERQQVLDGKDMRSFVMEMLSDLINTVIDENSARGRIDEKGAVNTARELFPVINCPEKEIVELYDGGEKMKAEKFGNSILKMAEERYCQIEEQFRDKKDVMRQLERTVLLRVIDKRWMEHIDQLAKLRQSIGLSSLAQKDPRIEYRNIAYEMFDDMTWLITKDSLSYLYRTEVSWETA